MTALYDINYKTRRSLPSGEDPSWRVGELYKVPRRCRCQGYRSDRSRRTRLWPRAARTARAHESPSTERTDPSPRISRICLPGSLQTCHWPGPDACPGRRRSTAGPRRRAPSSSYNGLASFHSLRDRNRSKINVLLSQILIKLNWDLIDSHCFLLKNCKNQKIQLIMFVYMYV